MQRLKILAQFEPMHDEARNVFESDESIFHLARMAFQDNDVGLCAAYLLALSNVHTCMVYLHSSPLDRLQVAMQLWLSSVKQWSLLCWMRHPMAFKIEFVP